MQSFVGQVGWGVGSHCVVGRRNSMPGLIGSSRLCLWHVRNVRVLKAEFDEVWSACCIPAVVNYALNSRRKKMCSFVTFLRRKEAQCSIHFYDFISLHIPSRSSSSSFSPLTSPPPLSPPHNAFLRGWNSPKYNLSKPPHNCLIEIDSRHILWHFEVFMSMKCQFLPMLLAPANCFLLSVSKMESTMCSR